MYSILVIASIGKLVRNYKIKISEVCQPGWCDISKSFLIFQFFVSFAWIRISNSNLQSWRGFDKQALGQQTGWAVQWAWPGRAPSINHLCSFLSCFWPFLIRTFFNCVDLILPFLTTLHHLDRQKISEENWST